MTAASPDAHTAEGVADMFSEWHQGDGHGPATAKQAAAVRRKEERARRG